MMWSPVPFVLERPAPPFGDNDIRYPENLVRLFLKKYTKPGDKVFDPFAGLGTTLFVAEELKRIPFGIEAEGDRHAWAAGQLKNWQNLIHGDAARMARMDLPKMDFAMTSPPFMAKNERWNPLASGNPAKAGYETYLRQMTRIFKAMRAVMKKNACVVVQVDNLHQGRAYTPLVRDLSLAIAKSLTLEDEILVPWTKPPRSNYTHTHCLVFKNA